MKSLAKIREKKPEIYKPETKFFPDEYIKTQVSADKKDKKSPFFYKDMVREEALNEQTDMKPTKLKILSEETPVEEQIRLKKEFQKASKLENLGDNLFSIKTKSEREIDNENVLFDNFIKEEIKKNRPDEVEMLKHFWGDDTKLDETDKFLRRYIMTKG